MRILSFGYDGNLLLPEDPTNEAQYRQGRYCDLLKQSKGFVILNSGCEYHERFLHSRRLWAVSVSAQRTLTRVLKAGLRGVAMGRLFRPDLVEYQDPQIAGFAAYLAARLLRVPLVGGIFNDFLDNPRWLRGSWPRRVLNALGKRVLAASVCVRCDSQETTWRLNQAGYTHVRYIPFFVPWVESFCVLQATQHERLTRWLEDPTVLSVARLSGEKNLALFLNAFARAFKTAGRGRVVIVGDGPLRGELTQLASQLGVASRVTWVGAVDYLALPRYYRDANILALSSDSETSARVLILAQAARLPTVTTDTSGSRAIVKDGLTGRVTPVGDTARFADALRELITERATYERMLMSDHYDAADSFGEAMVETQLAAFYADALQSRRDHSEVPG